MNKNDPRYYYKTHTTQDLIVQYESTTVTPQLHILKETGTQLPCNLPQLLTSLFNCSKNKGGIRP